MKHHPDVCTPKENLMTARLHSLVGLVLAVVMPRRDERGLSQSTENAILLAGAVAIAMAVIAAIKIYVEGKLPR
ncbi:hypothetical protein GCM10028815_21780 [Mariniluteicoccus flavus]